MKNLLSLLILISFIACNSNKKDNEVFIFNDITFKLLEGEKLAAVKPKIKEDYLSYFKNTNSQIPLLKIIKNKNYTIYLGIPFKTSIEKLIKFQIFGQTSDSLTMQSDSLTYFFKKQKKDASYISEYLQVFDKNYIYILATTNSKTISDSLFNKTELSLRFNQNGK